MRFLISLFITLSLFGCASVTLEPADFAWPVESVLNVDKTGMVQDNRFSFSVNVKPLFFAEQQDSTDLNMNTVRIIRGVKGYYYMIASGFKNIYSFNVSDGTMVLYNKIFISEIGVELPAFNQRSPNIELLDGERHLFYFNAEGKQGEK
ncbi:hypothetical protein BMS3Abin04_01484 [bacterium BMS3Abin04]|nr:hypothetical protein BMS3Abin04_01484 [bacterium BMS3Abin04]